MHLWDVILLNAAKVLDVKALLRCRVYVIFEPRLPEATSGALDFDVLFSVHNPEAILTKDLVHRCYDLVIEVIDSSKGPLGLFFEEVVRRVAMKRRHVLAHVELVKLLVPKAHLSDYRLLLLKLLLRDLWLVLSA